MCWGQRYMDAYMPWPGESPAASLPLLGLGCFLPGEGWGEGGGGVQGTSQSTGKACKGGPTSV